MRIKFDDCLCLVVDYQERLMPSILDHEELLTASKKLLAGLELLGVPRLVSRQYPEKLGDTVPVIKEVTQGARVMDKTHFSCCQDEAQMEAIKDFGRKTVILCGVETHVCVMQTGLDLLEAGYNVVAVVDCLSSRKAQDKKYGLKRLKREGAVLATYESLLFELMVGKSCPVFKNISALVK